MLKTIIIALIVILIILALFTLLLVMGTNTSDYDRKINDLEQEKDLKRIREELEKKTNSGKT